MMSKYEMHPKELKHKNSALTDSILYAERIQNTILPSQAQLEGVFKDFLVIFKPKDIVSGDFYWYCQIEGYVFVAVVDCTGHGVPGAFMSLVGNSLLNEIITQKRIFETDQILTKLNDSIREALKQKQSHNSDGMDLTLCRLEGNKDGSLSLQFSGAKSNLFYYQDGQLQELKGDRNNIGGYLQNNTKEFTQQNIILHEGDTLYLSSDGFADAPNLQRKKFGFKRLKELLSDNAHLPLDTQKNILFDALEKHTANTLQRDDITFLAIQLNSLPYFDKNSKDLLITPIETKNTHKSNFNFFEYQANIYNADVVLSYKGPFTDVLLAELSKDIRLKINKYPKAGKKVFSIFMELAQNVLFYSKEVNHFGNNDRVGTLVILDAGDTYKIMTGNLVYQDAAKFLREKCKKVNTLDRDGLREYKRYLRNASQSESIESKGAGIGIVQATLLSENPLGYSIKEVGDNHAFFLLDITVEKSIGQD